MTRLLGAEVPEKKDGKQIEVHVDEIAKDKVDDKRERERESSLNTCSYRVATIVVMAL